ncbi:MAG: signal peptidase I [Opitutales bacterium]
MPAEKSFKKLRKSADDIYRQAIRVYHYRRDVADEAQVERLRAAIRALGDQLKLKKDARPEDLSRTRDEAHQAAAAMGGRMYPRTFLSENVDMLLVAAILVIGVRTFFFQPFIIPTNSMFPTYHGMTHQVYTERMDPPPAALRALRTLVFGARHFRIEAPVSGKVRVPFFGDGEGVQGQGGRARFQVVSGRKWFGLLPAVKREYTLLVGQTPVSLRVPIDFNLDTVLVERFPELRDPLRRRGYTDAGGRPVLETEQTLEAGDSVLAFDILLGDALFVDRLSYHFIRPDIGDPFVFRTDEVPVLENGKYYIKRLVGKEGDTLEIREPVLYRNGEPITGAVAFALNAKEIEPFGGYVNAGFLGEGDTVTIPEDHFYAMGDNSRFSFDSRAWGYDPQLPDWRPTDPDDPRLGFVPEEAVIGRAFFIYYPFTRRWGPSD